MTKDFAKTVEALVTGQGVDLVTVEKHEREDDVAVPDWIVTSVRSSTSSARTPPTTPGSA
jgi:hypothetical protein